jgi:hypothetical protein
MEKEHKVTLVVVLVVAGAALGYGIGMQFKVLRPHELLKEPGIEVLFYFDGDEDIRKFDRTEFPVELSTRHVTQGMYSLKVTFPYKDGVLNAWRTIPRDWSGHDSLVIDAYNDQFYRIPLTITLGDENNAAFTKTIDLLAESNHIEIPVSEIKGSTDVTQMRNFSISVPPSEERNIIYFDNIKLEKRAAR